MTRDARQREVFANDFPTFPPAAYTLRACVGRVKIFTTRNRPPDARFAYESGTGSCSVRFAAVHREIGPNFPTHAAFLFVCLEATRSLGVPLWRKSFAKHTTRTLTHFHRTIVIHAHTDTQSQMALVMHKYTPPTHLLTLRDTNTHTITHTSGDTDITNISYHLLSGTSLRWTRSRLGRLVGFRKHNLAIIQFAFRPHNFPPEALIWIFSVWGFFVVLLLFRLLSTTSLHFNVLSIYRYRSGRAENSVPKNTLTGNTLEKWRVVAHGHGQLTQGDDDDDNDGEDVNEWKRENQCVHIKNG